MAGWTLEEAQNNLNMWLDAEKAIAGGQSYKIGSRSVSYADLKQVTDRISFWKRQVEMLELGKKSANFVRRVIPRDL